MYYVLHIKNLNKLNNAKNYNSILILKINRGELIFFCDNGRC